MSKKDVRILERKSKDNLIVDVQPYKTTGGGGKKRKPKKAQAPAWFGPAIKAALQPLIDRMDRNNLKS